MKMLHLSEITLRRGSRYLVKNLIPARDITVVWGKPKSGKTFWVMDLAMHIATGIKYRDRETASGPVIYCGLEGADGMPARVLGMCSEMNIKDRTVPPFYLCLERFQFGKVGSADGLIKLIEETLKEQSPALVILDTLNRSLEGSENSDEDMTHYTRCAEDVGKRFNCAIIVIHHCGVAGDKPRGHTSLTGTCAAQIKVDRANKMPVIEGKPMMISAMVEFMKDGPEGSVEYSWLKPITVTDPNNPDCEPEDTCCVAPAPEPMFSDELNVMSGHTKKALSVLQEAISQEDEERITITKWRGLFEAHTKGKKEAVRKAFYRSYEMLKEKDLITIEGQWVSLSKSNPGI